MCQECGCGKAAEYAVDGVPQKGGSRLVPLDAPIPITHTHDGHEHTHEHDHEHPHTHALDLQVGVLDKNARLAERNRGYFHGKDVLAVNVLSSPGSGKTALIERMIAELDGKRGVGVIVGDLETDNDAQRLRRAGAQAVQVTTGTVCHLDAEMVARAAEKLDFADVGLLLIENVGNLVCPAAYDLGEDLRAVLLSVTEGEDKPLKYPTIFKSAHVVIVNKIDIAEAVGFQRELALDNIRRVAPQAAIFELSARTGEGIDAWWEYLERCLRSMDEPHGAP